MEEKFGKFDESSWTYPAKNALQVCALFLQVLHVSCRCKILHCISCTFLANVRIEIIVLAHFLQDQDFTLYFLHISYKSKILHCISCTFLTRARFYIVFLAHFLQEQDFVLNFLHISCIRKKQLIIYNELFFSLERACNIYFVSCTFLASQHI